MALTQVQRILTSPNLNMHITDNVVYMRPYLSLNYPTQTDVNRFGDITYPGFKVGKTFSSTLFASAEGGTSISYQHSRYALPRVAEITSQLPPIGKKYYLTPDIKPIAENNNKQGVSFFLTDDEFDNDLSSVVIDNNQLIASQEVKPAVDLTLDKDQNNDWVITSITPITVPPSRFTLRSNPAGQIWFRTQAYQQRPTYYMAVPSGSGFANCESGDIPENQDEIIVSINLDGNGNFTSFTRIKDLQSSSRDLWKVYLAPYRISLVLDWLLPTS